jgi:hypothetical protein
MEINKSDIIKNALKEIDSNVKIGSEAAMLVAINSENNSENKLESYYSPTEYEEFRKKYISMIEMSDNHSDLNQNKNDYVPKNKSYTLRHTASMFSCYVSPEERKEEETRNKQKENKKKNILKKIFGF